MSSFHFLLSSVPYFGSKQIWPPFNQLLLIIIIIGLFKICPQYSTLHFWCGYPAVTAVINDRESCFSISRVGLRRPVLSSLDSFRRIFGWQSVTLAVLTHFIFLSAALSTGSIVHPQCKSEPKLISQFTQLWRYVQICHAYDCALVIFAWPAKKSCSAQSEEWAAMAIVNEEDRILSLHKRQKTNGMTEMCVYNPLLVFRCVTKCYCVKGRRMPGLSCSPDWWVPRP